MVTQFKTYSWFIALLARELMTAADMLRGNADSEARSNLAAEMQTWRSVIKCGLQRWERISEGDLNASVGFKSTLTEMQI